MTVKVIIFDFDGTIADTLDSVVSITNRLAGEFGYKPTSQEDLIILRNLNSRQIIKKSGVPIFKIPFLIRKVLAELNNEIQVLSAFPGIKETLIELRKQGKSLGIVTSNSKENVTAFLNKNGLQELFDFIYSGTTIFGKSKVMNRVLKSENLNPEEVLYVGDETRDIESAKKTDIKVIAVSWGFNSKEVLAEQSPDYLIHQPDEIIEVIRSLQQAGKPN